MPTRMLVALMVAATIALTACSSGSGDLTGKTWQLTAITEKTPAFQGVVPAAEQPRYTILFNTDGTFNATADCNQVSGTYKTSGSTLTITLGPSTMVACPEGSMGNLYAHALGNAASYAVAKDELTITLKDGGTLTFAVATATPSASAAAAASAVASASSASSAAASAKSSASATAKATATPTVKPTAAPTAKPSAAPTAKPSAGATAKPSAAPTAKPSAAPSPGAGLTGKAWQLTGITEKEPAFQGVVPETQQANYTVEFKTDGTFQSKADCNQVSGTYKATPDGELTMTLGASTIVACAEGSLSDLYILALGNAASYTIATGQLTITLADQGTLVYK